jgi:integrase
MSELLLDAAGRRRTPATMSGFRAGWPSCNKGMRCPADPPKVEEIVAVMRAAGDAVHGRRLRGLIVVLWRAGLQISEAPALGEADLDGRRGAVLVRRGKGGRRREVGMDDWAWQQLQPRPSEPRTAFLPTKRALRGGGRDRCCWRRARPRFR